MTGHYRKYKSISRRKFILSTTGAIAGITTAGVVGVSCIRKPGQPKTDLVEIDYIGPETLFPVYLSYFKKFKKTILHFKSLEEALFTGSNGSIVLLPLIQKAPVLLMLLQMDKDVLTPFPLAKDYEEFDALQKQSNLSDRRIAMLDPLRFWEPVQYFSSRIQSRIGSVRHIELIVNQTRPAESYLPPADGFTGNAARLIRLISCILKSNPSGLVTRHNDLLEPNPKGPPSSLVQLRIASTHDDARDTRPDSDIGPPVSVRTIWGSIASRRAAARSGCQSLLF